MQIRLPLTDCDESRHMQSRAQGDIIIIIIITIGQPIFLEFGDTHTHGIFNRFVPAYGITRPLANRKI